MTGRGYLKSRLAQQAAQELIINNELVLGNNSQTILGRQVTTIFMLYQIYKSFVLKMGLMYYIFL